MVGTPTLLCNPALLVYGSTVHLQGTVHCNKFIFLQEKLFSVKLKIQKCTQKTASILFESSKIELLSFF